MSATANTRSKAIVFCSAKGGSGKTSLAITAAVTALLSKKHPGSFRDVCYFDIDLDGTGTEYLLNFDRSVKKYINDLSDIRSVEDICHKVILTRPDSDKSAVLNAFLSNPVSRIAGNFYAHKLDDRINVSGLDSIFTSTVLELVKSYVNDSKRLLVFDSSPGYSPFAKDFIRRLREINALDVTEVFVTTFDHSHVEKTRGVLDNLVRVDDHVPVSRKLVFNDVHNMVRDMPVESRPGDSILSHLVGDDWPGCIERIYMRHKPKIVSVNTYRFRGRITGGEVADEYLDEDFYENFLK